MSNTESVYAPRTIVPALAPNAEADAHVATIALDQSVTLLVTPPGSLCPTSGDLRIRTTPLGGGILTTSLVRYTSQGADIDIGDDGSIDVTAVPCGPPADLVCM